MLRATPNFGEAPAFETGPRGSLFGVPLDGSHRSAVGGTGEPRTATKARPNGPAWLPSPRIVQEGRGLGRPTAPCRRALGLATRFLKDHLGPELAQRSRTHPPRSGRSAPGLACTHPGGAPCFHVPAGTPTLPEARPLCRAERDERRPVIRHHAERPVFAWLHAMAGIHGMKMGVPLSGVASKARGNESILKAVTAHAAVGAVASDHQSERRGLHTVARNALRAAPGGSPRPSVGAFTNFVRLYEDHDEEDTWNL